MQPIIDIILEKLVKYVDFYLSAHPPDCCYVDRGDPAAWDFGTGDFTKDDGWHVLDLSSIVPVGAKAVSLVINLRSTSSQKKFTLRRNGNVNENSALLLWTQAANHRIGGVFTVSCDSDRKIEYRAENVTFDIITVHVDGWFVGSRGAAGFVDRGDPAAPDFQAGDLVKDDDWHELDLSGIIPADTKSVLMICDFRSTVGARRIRFRTCGNVNLYNISHCRAPLSAMNYAYDITVPTGGQQKIEYNATAATYPELILTVKGWWL